MTIFPMPSSTIENYLKQILLEQHRSGQKRVAMGKVARSLEVVPGTATTMVKALARDGLVDYRPRKGVRLTAEGERMALSILRRHRLVEVFLVQVLGLDWSEIHADAEVLEHALSDRVLERIDAICGHPGFDPHGDPIPSASGQYRSPELQNLLECPLAVEMQVSRISHQEPAFLVYVDARGLAPGNQVTVTHRDLMADSVRLQVRGHPSLTVGSKVARRIQVMASPLAGPGPTRIDPLAAAE